MTLRTLIRRSLRFHARSHLGTALGAAVAAAVLIGALVVGDSVRGSLRQRAIGRLGGIHYAITVPDRRFRAQLADDLSARDQRFVLNSHRCHFAPALILTASATAGDGSTRANRVQLIGVDSRLAPLGGPGWATAIPSGGVRLNEGLARQLGLQVGDTVVLRANRPSALSQDAIIAPQSDAVLVLRLQVSGIVPAGELGNLSFRASQIPPFNAFVDLETLQRGAGVSGKANSLLAGNPSVGGIRTVSPLVARFYQARAWLFGERSPAWPQRYGEKTLWLAATTEEVSAAALRNSLSSSVRSLWRAEDAEVELREPVGQNVIELRSPRVFLDPAVVTAAFKPVPGEVAPDEAARMTERGWTNELAALRRQRALLQGGTNGQPLLTYLVNRFRAGTNTTPYSMVTAAGPPFTPADLRDDQIVVNEWLADDLQVQPGDRIELTYFDPDSGARLVERTNTLRVRAIVPLKGIHADRTLMPEFPGLAKAESTHDWDAGFPLVHKIRDQDEDYWKQCRGTPKAFVTLAAGQKMWANRFGSLTAIRYPVPTNSSAAALAEALDRHLLASLDPGSVGLAFEPVREQALKAVAQAQDFGQLFLGFSFFLIAAALLLMALLFQFSIEQRATEVGTLLALGFTPKQVRRLFWLEGGALAAVGSLIGLVGGVGYARAMLHGLSTIWRDAVGASALGFHAEPATLAIGYVAAVGAAWLTVGWALRKQVQQPARELLAGEGPLGRLGGGSRGDEVHSHSELGTRNSEFSRASLRRLLRARGLSSGSPAGWLALAGAGALVATALARGDTASAGTFFGAGALLLGAGLAFASTSLRRLGRSEAARRLTLLGLGVRNATRRRTRSLATLGLLACGSFLIASIGVFRLDSVRDAEKPTSGTGGFALVGESTLPVIQDLNTERGRDSFALDAQTLSGVRFVPFRVRDGDDASCLNLNRAQKPRLLGVNPEALSGRFTFAKLAEGEDPISNAWARLRSQSAIRNPQSAMEVPAIGDAASIQWAMGKRVGDTLDYVDEQGRPFKVRLVGAVANSILQGNLLIDEAAFVRLFPSEAGYRVFLIDAPAERATTVSGALSLALRDLGLELTPTARRLAQFNAVQNTYLGTFQVLGGLGLLLGSAGLGVVVLRNVLERRAELALLLAVGFRARTVRRLVVGEHATLLIVGLGVGLLSAAVAVLPSLLSPGTDLPYRSLGATVGAVFLSGLAWTWLATKVALRGELLSALRNE
jgi:ABC-type lipoprotein release transport system permease subunit